MQTIRLLKILPLLVFLAALWYGFRQTWPFGFVILLSFGVWGALVALPYIVRRLP